MSRFPTGRFERSQASGPVRYLIPSEASAGLAEVDLERLAAEGKRLVLIDVDNTLLPWRSVEIPASTLAWIRRGRELGLSFCLVSNTRNRRRLREIAARLEVSFAEGKFKPRRAMFLQAMEMHAVGPEQTVMIGDQLFTDVLGANRAGIDVIWVRPMHPREFVSTRLNRLLERLLRPVIWRYLETDDDLPILPRKGIFSRRVVRQFAKFCIVGMSSFLIDAGLHKILMFHATWGGVRLSEIVGSWLLADVFRWPTFSSDDAWDAAFAFFKVFSAGLAMLNSFYWNRRWTFGIVGREERLLQLSRFLVVSLVGMGLNVVISSAINRAIAGATVESWGIGTVVAAGIVALWNFSGQRLWAFRRRRAR